MKKLSKKQRGALSETHAMAWLLERGFEVYMQVGEGLIDLLAYDPATFTVVRCEVKTATTYEQNGGVISFYWQEREAQMEHADMLLIVSSDGLVWDGMLMPSGVTRDAVVASQDSAVVAGEVRVKLETAKKGRPGGGKAKPPKRPILDSDGHRIVYDD